MWGSGIEKYNGTDVTPGELVPSDTIDAITALTGTESAKAREIISKIVTSTTKACDNVEILSERTVTPFELSFLRELSANHRKEGIRMAEDIVKQYRREGKYFDELLMEG